MKAKKPSKPNNDPLPEFDRPPVIEVVCGIMFKPLELMLAPHLGRLWSQFEKEYPKCQEVAPLAPVVEQFGESSAIQIEVTDTPPLPRVWFIHKDETGIIQIQRDRFLHNWKKVRPADEYPRYKNVIKRFDAQLTLFESFLNEHRLGVIEPRQYELTYVNHLPAGHGFKKLDEIRAVLPDFAWRSNAGRFFPEPETVHWRTSFTLPEGAGRLHVTIRNARRRDDNVPILLLELAARGVPKHTSKDAKWAWFEIAHQWIVRGFADITDPKVQETVWKRTR